MSLSHFINQVVLDLVSTLKEDLKRTSIHEVGALVKQQ